MANLKHFKPFLLAALLGGCTSINYSPANLAQGSSNTASIASGMAESGSGGAIIKKVNGVLVAESVPGREIIAPAGKVNLNVYWFYTTFYKLTDLEGTLKAGAYYTVTPIPNLSEKTIRYEIEEVSQQDFRAFLCKTQRIAQANLSKINPQPAPACEEQANR